MTLEKAVQQLHIALQLQTLALDEMENANRAMFGTLQVANSGNQLGDIEREIIRDARNRQIEASHNLARRNGQVRVCQRQLDRLLEV